MLFNLKKNTHTSYNYLSWQEHLLRPWILCEVTVQNLKVYHTLTEKQIKDKKVLKREFWSNWFQFPQINIDCISYSVDWLEIYWCYKRIDLLITALHIIITALLINWEHLRLDYCSSLLYRHPVEKCCPSLWSSFKFKRAQVCYKNS